MKYFLVLILVLISNHILSQNNDVARLFIGPEKYDKMQADFEILSKTEFFKDLENTKMVYMSKIQFIPSEANETDENYIIWITENIKETKFESVEEALFLRRKLNKLEAQLNDEYPDIYDLMKSMNVEQIREIKK